MKTTSLALLRQVSAIVLLGASFSAQSDFMSAREAMWPAPTAEDWKKPCLITFQRTWEDAIAVSKKTGQQILVCINMDGEIASEHYAGVRYRQAEIASLYEPYVCVIASVYRHSPRDYDEEGRRVLCPRFGSVTCGEHIKIEPILFEQFMDGRRIAPRHIGVELDGAETYDVYYAFDTDSVFQTIREGASGRAPVLADQGERSLEERIASPDVADRVAVEAEYVAADQENRRKLLRAAIQAGDQAPVDMLRLAVFGLDAELNKLALLALAKAESESAVGLIAEALRVPMAEDDREALIAALERLGGKFPEAATLAAVHRGLASRSDSVDLDGWSSKLAGAQAPAPQDDRLTLEYRLENKAYAFDPKSNSNPELWVELAEASLALAVDPETAMSLASSPKTGSKYSTLLFEDARDTARRAEEAGASGWRLNAVMALSSYYMGDFEEAFQRAETTVAEMPSGEDGWNAMAVLALFAQGRQRSIYRAVRSGKHWPSEWLTDVNAAYSILAKHPHGTDSQVVSHYDFLKRLGGSARAATVLDAGLERFPDSWALHDRFRARVLDDKGVAGLESAYEEMLAKDGDNSTLLWFAGYSTLVAAEYHRRSGENARAQATYDQAIRQYEGCIEKSPETAANCDHYIAVALAGQARLALERREYTRAVEDLERSFARKPEAASTLDGLGLSAIATARTLQARMAEAGDQAGAQRVQDALDSLDPDLLLPPAFERQGPSQGRRRQRGNR